MKMRAESPRYEKWAFGPSICFQPALSTHQRSRPMTKHAGWEPALVRNDGQLWRRVERPTDETGSEIRVEMRPAVHEVHSGVARSAGLDAPQNHVQDEVGVRSRRRYRPRGGVRQVSATLGRELVGDGDLGAFTSRRAGANDPLRITDRRAETDLAVEDEFRVRRREGKVAGRRRNRRNRARSATPPHSTLGLM